jgi:serine/threonine protein kinase
MAARYKILEELGAGGAGAVFKAYDTQLDRYVAIKRLMTKEESEKQDAHSGTLKKEAASLATLQHPNIVSVYDLGSDDEGFFMVMELVEGETLSDWVRTTPMNIQDFQELATQSLEALMTAHSQSILHRDLKPENIKLKRLPGGRIQVKVLDFGLARMSYGAKKMTEDQSGNVVGSIFYMAPEQFLRKPVDVRTDLYSLGCVFYQALSCRRPYADETVQGVMDAHLKHMVHPLHTIAPEVPSPVSDWVMWLINAEPAHRPANVEAALHSLREIINAGWFNESITAAIPVAIPEVSTEGWHETATIPRAPTTSHVRTASGAISQRMIPGQPVRPSGTSSATHGAKPSAPAPPRPAPVMRPVPVDEGEGFRLPFWIWPTAAFAFILVCVWFFWNYKNSAPAPSRTGVPTTQIKRYDPEPRPAGLFQPKTVVHYVSGQKMDAWPEPGEQPAPAKPDDRIMSWHDDAVLGGDAPLVVAEKLKGVCPKFLVEKPAGFRFPIGMAHFEADQAMVHRMPKSDPQSLSYPFGDAESTGVTILMLVRPQIRNYPVRCLRVRNPDGSAVLDIRAYPNNEWKLVVKSGPLVKEAKLAGRSVTEFNLVGVTWNTATSKALLSVRGESGAKGRIETAAPKQVTGPLSEIRIAESARDPSKPVAPEDKFSGDIAEIVIWPYAMEWEERSGQEWRLVQYLFTNPGQRY